MRNSLQDTRTFRSILASNEYRALKGYKNGTILYLFVVFFVTFLAFGFVQSTLTYHRKLSSDPFSNWINLNFHSGTRDSLRTLNQQITNEPFRERFHIIGSYFYNKGMVSVMTALQGNRAGQYEARTIAPQSGIVRDLLGSGLCARYFPDSIDNAFDFEPNGVIVSEKLLEDAGLEKQTISFIRMKSPAGDYIPVPVLAVVRELPDLSDIVFTNLFYCKSFNPDFYDRENGYYRIFVENMDTAGILKVLGELNSALEIQDASTVQTTNLQTGNNKVMNWKIEIGSQENDISINEMGTRIAGLASLENHHFGRYFELSGDTACDNSAFFHDYLAIEFRDLEKIRDFSQYLREDLKLQLDLETLADRENYLYTGNIAVGAIVLLALLSIISVSMYLSSIIRNHLFKIKKNLGNFLAFGIKNETLMWLYIRVSVKILVTAMVPAMALALACGELFEHHLLGKLLVIDREQDYFSLINLWFALFLALILLVALFRTFISVRKTLRQTPGNLIYERDP